MITRQNEMKQVMEYTNIYSSYWQVKKS